MKNSVEKILEKRWHVTTGDVYKRQFDTSGVKERTEVYIPITCLRGITWCAMAWVQYQNPDKAIFNASTFRKLEAYLDHSFLNKMKKEYLEFL